MQPCHTFYVGEWILNSAPHGCQVGTLTHSDIFHLPQLEELKWVISLRNRWFSDCGLCASLSGHGYKYRKHVLRNGLEESASYVTFVLPLPAELLFKEVQAKVNQPDRIVLSSAKVWWAKSPLQWRARPCAFFLNTVVSDHVLQMSSKDIGGFSTGKQMVWVQRGERRPNEKGEGWGGAKMSRNWDEFGAGWKSFTVNFFKTKRKALQEKEKIMYWAPTWRRKRTNSHQMSSDLRGTMAHVSISLHHARVRKHTHARTHTHAHM